MAEQQDNCGYDPATPPLEALQIIAELPQRAGAILAAAGDAAFQRPEPTVWSAHEYLWHLVDNLRISAEWMHDVHVIDHPTHYHVDMDAIVGIRGYSRLSQLTGLWSLEDSVRLFVREATATDLTRTFYYDGWRDCTAAEIVGFMLHEAVHHLLDMQRVNGGKNTHGG